MPTWSADGHRIVFYSQRSGWPEIRVINADGSWSARHGLHAYSVAEKKFRKVRVPQSMAAMIDSLNSTAVQKGHDVYSESRFFHSRNFNAERGNLPQTFETSEV